VGEQTVARQESPPGARRGASGTGWPEAPADRPGVPTEKADDVRVDGGLVAAARSIVTPNDDQAERASPNEPMPGTQGSARAASSPASRLAPAQPVASQSASAGMVQAGRGTLRTAGSAIGSGMSLLRNAMAFAVWSAAVLAALVLALGALLTALDQVNQTYEVVTWMLYRGRDLVGPFGDLFRLDTAKNTLLINWGIAALAYLIGGKRLERFVRS